MDLHDMPIPHPISVFLVASSIGFNWLQHVTHDGVSGTVSIITGLCAIASYGYRFIMWCIRTFILGRKQYAEYKIRKNKSGGKQ